MEVEVDALEDVSEDKDMTALGYECKGPLLA